VNDNVINPMQRYIVKLLRDCADQLEADGADVRLAFALFVEQNGEIEVAGGGFADDDAAKRYLASFIRNQGFKS
jgi:hypothetical protein